MTRLLAIALALAPAVAQAQFLPTGMESMPSGKRPAFLFTAPAPGDYATLTTATGQTITCSRASTATVQTSASTITSVAANHCAVDYRGLQVEGLGTNMLTQSVPGTAGWVAGGTAPPTVTLNAALSPDPTSTTATRLDLAANSGSGGSWLQIQSASLNTSAATPYSYSVWVRGVSASGDIYLTFNASTNAAHCFFTTAWSRCVLAGNVPGSTAAPFLYIGVIGSFGQGDHSAQSVYVWGAQVEQQSFATSLIPTNGTSASRAGDTVSTTKPATVTMAGASAAYSLSVTARVEGLLTAAQEVVGSNANFVPLFQAETGSANQVAGYSDTVPNGATYSAAGLDALKVSQALRYAMNVSSGKVQACANGSCGSALSVGAQPAEPSTIFLGCFSGGSAPLFGWISAACVSRTATGCAP